MPPAPAVAVRNTNTVAEGKIIMMSDERLQQALKEAADGLDKLSNSKKPLTKEEKKDRGRLLKRKYILDRIKEAKEKNHRSEELYNSSIYELLVPWGEKHPFLMFVLMHLLRVRWQSGLSPIALRDSPERKSK